jgi:hypothetical protein
MSEEKFEVEIEGSGTEVELEVVDDTPEQDRGKPRRAEGQEPEIPDDEEIKNYSDNVQSRINKLKYEFHEERRAKEEAQRTLDAAVSEAQRLMDYNKKLQEQLQKGQGQLVTQAKSRIEAQLMQAKQAFKQAYEAGDSDAVVEAQEKLSALSAQKARLDAYKPKAAPQQQTQQTQQIAQRAPQQAPKIEVDPKAKEWASRNEWFGKDEEMTGYAFGVHERLVKEGVDPRGAEYYERLDEAVSRTFPEKFGKQRNTGNVVAPVARSSKTPRKVTLTKSQVDLARRLGITPEKYAAQLMKEMQA